MERKSSLNRGALVRRAAVAVVVAAVAVAGLSSLASAGPSPRPTPARAVIDSGEKPVASAAAVTVALGDSLHGRSGKLLARLIPTNREDRGALAFPFLRSLFGNAAPKAGVYTVEDSARNAAFTFITMRPFTDKVNGWVDRYHIGFWPAEHRSVGNPAYANPRGFIEVTPQNEDTRISEHFRLRDFLTHDQQDVWPKYLVLREDLVDKLELVIADLEAHGHPVEHMTVMSGFRTPQYNATGGETGGRAQLSRHMYGDAADVFVDNDGDGRMDDLNHDGRVDYHDAQVILDAVERVERAHPDVTGGVGVYRATSSHGPFAHVDVRGWRARWGLVG